VWANEETVCGVFTLSSRKSGGPGLFAKGAIDTEANTIDLRILMPVRIKVGVVDQLAGVLTGGMPRPYLIKVAAGIDFLVRGHGFWGDSHNQLLLEPKWLTPKMTIKPLKKACKPASVMFIRRTLNIQQKRLDIEVARFEDMRASRQASITAQMSKLPPLS